MIRDPRRQFLAILKPAAAVLGILFLSSCSRFSAKNRHLKQADQFFDSGSYVEAEIEYKNVLQSDPLNARAIVRIGTIYYYEGSIMKALPYVLKGSKLQPDNLDLRLKLAQISIELGDLKGAADEAKFILAENPKDPDAPLLLAEAAKPNELREVGQRLSQMPLRPQDRAGVLIALGYLSSKEQKASEAEALFRQALLLDPKSSTATFGLGTLYWQRRDVSDAGNAFEEAYRLAPPRSPTRLKFAQFKIETDDLDGARRVLNEIIQDAPDYLPALILLAEMDLVQKKFDDAAALNAKVLQLDSANPEALLLDARIKLARGEPDKAIASLERMKTAYPRSAPIFNMLGQAYLAEGDMGKAIASLDQALAINPNLSEAAVLLATTDLRKGDFKSASSALAGILQKHPESFQAQLLQAEALRGLGDLEAALKVYRGLEKSRALDPQMRLYVGIVLLQQNRKDEAKQEFNEALKISPTYLPAVEQLINIDLIDRKYSEALARANSEIAKDPNSEIPRLFVAKVYIAQNDFADAETALLKTIELKPDAPTAYFLLAQLYEATKQQEKALADLKVVLAKDPKSLGALMMTGTIYDSQNNYSAARDAYEKILSIDANFTSALNNLAYLESEKLGDLDKGFEMAQRARALQPNEPHVADTLGWILYRKHQYKWALGLIQESAGRLPAEAEIQFHLGMIHYMMGEEQTAQAALQHALDLPGAFPGRSDAKQRLSILALVGTSLGTADRAETEKSLSQNGDDPVALSRLAELHELDGKTEDAVADMQKALQINPDNVATTLKLIRLYSKQGDTKRALELAKKAHNFAADDPTVSVSLSQLAYQTADYQWAYSLIKEATPSKADDPDVLYDLGNAAFAVGRVQEAEEAMRHSLEEGLEGVRKDGASRFLNMIAIIKHPSREATETQSIDEVLKVEPKFAPAIMALGEIDEAKFDSTAAVANYEMLLGEFPDFAPAKKRLAILYLEDPSKDQRTSELAISAREAFPGDPELAKALGIVAYRNKNFAMATGLLQESKQTRQGDAELAYFLGMAEFELGSFSASSNALKNALDIGLDTIRAAQARRTLDTIKSASIK